jgi:hypothetical protein
MHLLLTFSDFSFFITSIKTLAIPRLLNSFSITVACLINKPIIEASLILILTFLDYLNNLIRRFIN